MQTETLEEINRLTQAAYNKAAQKYYDLFYDELEKKEFDRKFIDDYLDYLNPGSLICSAGCGPCGHIENYISQRGFKVVGIDISEKCIKIAKEHFPELRFETGDFTKMKYQDEYFDGIVSYYSIIDTPGCYLNEVLKEFKRVLKKDGYLLIVVKEGTTEGYEEDLLGIPTKIYYSLFTKEKIEAALTKAGFEKITTIQRKPYRDEIQIERIYSIGRKVKKLTPG